MRADQLSVVCTGIGRFCEWARLIADISSADLGSTMISKTCGAAPKFSQEMPALCLCSPARYAATLTGLAASCENITTVYGPILILPEHGSPSTAASWASTSGVG